MKKVIRFHNGRVLRNQRFDTEDLWIADGKIVPPQFYADETINAQQRIIAPGYIDLQINGGYGIDLATQPERVAELAAYLPRHGVTAFLPTLISSPQENYARDISILKPRGGGAHGAEILGVHLEGPFLNPLMARAHDKRWIVGMDHWQKIYHALDGVKLVTLAPELPGAQQMIEFLHRHGIVVSAGHSLATCEQIHTAMKWGLKMVTHLFNAMTLFDHRHPGIVGAALTEKGLYFSLIADLQHVHPVALQMAWKAHPQGLCLVSDAIQALGKHSGLYTLGERVVEVNPQGAYIKGTQTLAGSVIGLDAAVRHFWKATGCSEVYVLEAASRVPAYLLGLENIKGALTVGADADLILLDDQLHVQECYVAGCLVSALI